MNNRIILLTALLSTQAIAAQKESDTEKFCNQATHNVLIGYNQAKQGVTMLELMTAYPDHKQEILAGYKLYELGKGEYEAYYIFKEYCLSVMTGA